MRTATNTKKPNAKQMTDAEWRALVSSMAGKYKTAGGLDEFLREKHEETERENAAYVQQYGDHSRTGTW